MDAEYEAGDYIESIIIGWVKNLQSQKTRNGRAEATYK